MKINLSPPLRNGYQYSSHCRSCVVLILILFTASVGRCIGGVRRDVFMNSPFGVGIQSALKSRNYYRATTLVQNRRSNKNVPIFGTSIETTTTTSYSEEEKDEEIEREAENDGQQQHLTRFASISSNDEAQIIGMAQSANLVRQRRASMVPGQDKFEDDEVQMCVLVDSSEPVDETNPSPSSSENDEVTASPSTSGARGGTSIYPVATARQLVFWESMVSGAISRSIAQTVMHPANTMKTILQSSRGAEASVRTLLTAPDMIQTLSRGAGANFVLSVPHGAVNFAVLEFVRHRLNLLVETVPLLANNADRLGAGLDFMSSAISTICCSIVSTPQMMITDNIMAGNYRNLIEATKGLYDSQGIIGFYAGWWPGLVGKIPSYALTWTFFQQLKQARDAISDRPAKNYENTIMGCIASGTSVCIMMPMDTIKTRLVTQLSATATTATPYKGIADCAVRVLKEEGFGTFYRGLAPRLFSVVPMIGIQFGVYEFMKKAMLYRKVESENNKLIKEQYGAEEALEEAAMEVAADPEQPFPAPRFLNRMMDDKKVDDKKKKKTPPRIRLDAPRKKLA